MLEKKVYKFTRNGIQSNNLTTGEKSMATVSEFGKQTRYIKPQQTHYTGNDKNTNKNINRFSQSTKSSIKTNEENAHESDSAVENQKLINRIKNGSRITYATVKKIHNHSINKKIANSKSAIKATGSMQVVLDKLGSGGKSIAKTTVNSLIDNTKSNDELGINTVSNIGKYTRGTYRSGKNVYKTAKWAKSTRAGQAVSRATTQTVALAKSAVKQTVAYTAKLFSNPIALKGLLIVAAVILAVILIQMMFSAIIGGMTGSTFSENAQPELKSYITELDNNFKSSIETEKRQLIDTGIYDSVSVIGMEAVNTSPDDMLILLSTFNDFDTEVSNKTCNLLNQYHKVLNTYNVETFDTVTDDGQGNTYTTTNAVIRVETYTAQQRMLTFSPNKEQEEMMLAFFELHNQMGDTNIGLLKWPFKIHFYISSPYGERIDPITNKVGEFHPAIDIPAPIDTPILSAQSGTVIFTSKNGTYGNLIKLEHENGMQTWYAHCNSFVVSVGDKVTTGQHIANSGNTGNSTGPHLHFEVRINSRHQNPQNYY